MSGPVVIGHVVQVQEGRIKGIRVVTFAAFSTNGPYQIRNLMAPGRFVTGGNFSILYAFLGCAMALMICLRSWFH
jgi:hypothetical protein